MGKIIGIDLGTTNSVVSVMEGDSPVVILNPEGSRTTPSVVAFTDDGRLTGVTAKRQAITNPERTIFSIKRFMGRRGSECKGETRMVPYRVKSDDDQLVTIEVDGKQYSPPEISAMVLQYLRRAAEDYLGEKVSDAVITVPAYFNDAQRQATKDAGTIAGLNVRRIINEPTAAALAYGLDKNKKSARIAVFDLGGGTFDISILELGDGVFEVLATNGDTHLGGDDYDEVLIHHIADEFKKEHGIDLRKDRTALQRIKEAAERAKCELSTKISTEIIQPFISSNDKGPINLNMRITRAKFEALTEKLTERCLEPCLNCLRDANLTPSQVDEVILVGGSTRMPAVQALVKEVFKREPSKGVNPDEVVAMGAAIQGGILAGELSDILLLDVTPLTLGVETMGGIMTPVIERNTTIPVRRTEIFSTAADYQIAVEIHVLQGERKMARDNRTLGQFQLVEIPPAPRGVPQIEVSFDIDANGILKVTAKDLATKKEQTVEIKSSTALSTDDVDRMVREAKEHEDEDTRNREFAETKNMADSLLYETEKNIREHRDKLAENDIKDIESASAKLRDALNTDDRNAIETALNELRDKSLVIGKVLYEQAAKEQAEKAQDIKQGKDDSADAVDADFTVKE